MTAKLVTAALSFVLIFGGWAGYSRYRDSHVQLPDDQKARSACALWFIGSSSIHRWVRLDQDMAPWVAHNRGINGATYRDLLPRFAQLKASEERPASLILYAGENDIASGAPVRDIVHALAHFLALRDREMPGVPVLILSMKPSPGRWASRPQQLLFNDAARRLIPHFADAYYIDATSPLLISGRLGDNYQADGVHMNEAGYRIWSAVVRGALRQVLPPATLRRCDA